MKTTREILEILDVMDASVSSFRKLNEWSGSKDRQMWTVALKAERNGVAIEVKPQFGATFDDALAAAWTKFEPATSGGLPQLAIADGSFEVFKTDDQEMPF